MVGCGAYGRWRFLCGACAGGAGLPFLSTNGHEWALMGFLNIVPFCANLSLTPGPSRQRRTFRSQRARGEILIRTGTSFDRLRMSGCCRAGQTRRSAPTEMGMCFAGCRACPGRQVCPYGDGYVVLWWRSVCGVARGDGRWSGGQGIGAIELGQGAWFPVCGFHLRGSLNSQTKCNTCIECCHGKCISAPHP